MSSVARRALSASARHSALLLGSEANSSNSASETIARVQVPEALRTATGQPSYSSVYPPVPRTDRPPASLAPIEQLEPTHNVLVGRMQLRAYDNHVDSLDEFVVFARRAAAALGIPCTAPKMLPTKTTKITTIRGPFIHAKSKENFWRRTHKRSISVYDANEDVVKVWIDYLEQRVMAGVGMRSEVIRRLPLGFAEGAVERTLGESQKERSAVLKRAETFIADFEASLPAIEAPATAPATRASAASSPSAAVTQTRSAEPAPSTSAASVSAADLDDLTDLDAELDAVEQGILSESQEDFDLEQQSDLAYLDIDPDREPLSPDDLSLDDLQLSAHAATPSDHASQAGLSEVVPAAETVPDAKATDARGSAMAANEALDMESKPMELVDEADGPVAEGEKVTELPIPSETSR